MARRLPMTPKEKKKLRIDIICYIILLIPLAFISLPFLLTIANSLRPGDQLYIDQSLIPKNPTLENYVYVIQEFNFFHYLKNSCIISACSTFCSVMVGCITGYAISRFKGKFFSVFKVFTYAIQMIPLGLVFLPMYIVIQALGLYDTYGSVILLYTSSNLCLTIWIMKGFFDSIPIELEEAAFVDGCGHYRSYFRIVFPLAGPGIACCCILTFMGTYNELAMASIFLKSESIQPITLGLQKFCQQFTNADTWGFIFAGAVLTTLPAVLVVFFAQKYIIAGLSGAGSLKG